MANGELPEGWETITIGEAFDVRQGKSLSAAKQTGLASKPFLRTSNVLWGKLDLSQLDRMDFSPKECEALALRPGDLLVCEGGDIGRTARWNGEIGDCYYQNHLHRLRAKLDDVDPTFVMYWLQAAITLWNRLEGYGNKTTIPNLSRSRLMEIAFTKPRVKEQHAIAGVLSKLQGAVEAQDKIVATLKELKAATLAKLFREGLRGQPEITETAYGEIPAHWSVSKLDQCADVQTGVAKGRKLNGGHLVERPYLRVANVQDGYLDLREIKVIQLRASEVDRFTLRDGDVLLTEGGDFDKLGRGFIWHEQVKDCVHQNHIFAVRTKRALMLPEFLTYLIQSPYGKAYFLNVAHKTTNLACINSTKLKELPVLLPPIEEQAEIASSVEGIDHSIGAATWKREALNRLLSSMLHLFMTGEVRTKGMQGGEREGKQAHAIRA